MAKNAATHPSPAPSSTSQPPDSRPALAPVIEINVRHMGRTPQPEKLTGTEAPEGWIKRIDTARWLRNRVQKARGQVPGSDSRVLRDDHTRRVPNALMVVAARLLE